MMMTREILYDRMHHRDAAWDGRFLFGVTTTGIYCRPSCGARRPRPENVAFFPSPEAAEAAGLRPCKRCRPDLFHRGLDPDRERVEELVRDVRRAPEEFASGTEMVRRAGVGATKLNQLLRRHYHRTPADLLSAARVERVCRDLLGSRRSVSDAAFDAGFETLSAFGANFKRRTRMRPQAYRRLGTDLRFELELPSWFDRRRALAYLGRDPESLTQRVDGNVVRFAMAHGDGTGMVTLELRPRRAECEVEVVRPGAPGPWGPEVHRRALRLLGLEDDPAAFERQVKATPELAPLVAGREGLTIPQTHDLVDGLIWVVVGQQVSLKVAFMLRRRLAERYGRPVGSFALQPDLETLAGLEPGDLQAISFSRRKAEYLVDAARAAVSGELDLAGLEEASATAVEERLLALRGFGPWSVHYLMMRALGLADCVPLGDVALAKSLQGFFGLDERPTKDRVGELMAPFAPYRSFATFHLWHRLGDAQ